VRQVSLLSVSNVLAQAYQQRPDKQFFFKTSRRTE